MLTNDGDLALRVTHPRYGCKKTYLAKVKGHPTPESLQRISRGMVLDGHRTAPAKVAAAKPSNKGRRPTTHNSWWSVEIGEGRTRQIREMFFRIGHPVQRLQRVAIGPVEDAKLPVGSYRELTESEIVALRGKGR
jgi:pseudouridine synthase